MVGEIVTAILAAIGSLAVNKGAQKVGDYTQEKYDKSKNQNHNSTGNKVGK